MNLNEFWSPFCGAVSITFDDGTDNQLEKAVPLLDSHRILGTFYLHPHGSHWERHQKTWQAIGETGHEIGNHSLSHYCPNNLTGRRGNLEDLTLADIEKDIRIAQERLSPIAPHQKNWTFAYPCYCTYVGQGIAQQSYVPLVAQHFLAGRAGGEYGFGNWPGLIDLANISAMATDRMSGFEMIGLVEELTTRGQWVVLVFHEINGPRLTVGSHDFQMLLNYLQRKSNEIWTAPVAAVASKIAEYNDEFSAP
ncbi:MAG: polysaccharide deacetylase family protein [Candidatus Zhuqueibacterota bacterium]